MEAFAWNSPWERRVPSDYSEVEAVDSTLLICQSILRSELIVAPCKDIDSTLVAPLTMMGICLVLINFRDTSICLVLNSFSRRLLFSVHVVMFTNSSVAVCRLFDPIRRYESSAYLTLIFEPWVGCRPDNHAIYEGGSTIGSVTDRRVVGSDLPPVTIDKLLIHSFLRGNQRETI